MPLFERDYRAWQGWVDRKLKKLLKSVGNYPEMSGNKYDVVTGDGVFTDVTQIIEEHSASRTFQISSVTIPQNSWVLVEGVYESVITDARIAGNFVEVIPYNNSIDIVKAAEIFPMVISSTDFVKVFAKKAPTGDIVVNLNISE